MSIKKIEGNLESVADQLEKAVAKAQEDLIPVLIKALQTLDYSGGKVVLSNANLIKTSGIIETLREALESGVYLEGLRDYSKSFPIQADLINTYYASQFAERFAEKQVFNTVVAQAQKQALDALRASAIDQFFEEPMRELIQKSITTGASYEQMVKQLSDVVVGNAEREGKLLKHVKQVARDSFSNYSRSYSDVINNDIGVEWYGYDGGTVRDSRDFCLERVGKIWHRKEIELWGMGLKSKGANLQYPEGGTWQGRAQGTSDTTIFSYLGGYNCIHYLGGLPESLVPSNVIDRVKAQGLIE